LNLQQRRTLIMIDEKELELTPEMEEELSNGKGNDKEGE
jgi:hypothetical protein